jgi:5-methyltetrahydrofolate--homocysteine methyltransferase
MIIVGELINASRRAVKAAIEARDAKTIRKLAKDQTEAGADYIDVNAGVFIDKEIEHLKWVADQVLAVTEKPCCIDSSNPRSIEAMVAYLADRKAGTPMVNSVSLEADRYEGLLPVIAGTDLKVIALCMGEDGMPETAAQRLANADRLINGLTRNNVSLENVHLDPLVQALATKNTYGIEFLNAVEAIMTGYPGVHTMCGLSNISFGLPARRLMNQTLMVMAICKGLDGAILNPLDRKMMASILTAEALAGKDSYCMNYLKAFRAGVLDA